MVFLSEHFQKALDNFNNIDEKAEPDVIELLDELYKTILKKIDVDGDPFGYSVDEYIYIYTRVIPDFFRIYNDKDIREYRERFNTSIDLIKLCCEMLPLTGDAAIGIGYDFEEEKIKSERDNVIDKIHSVIKTYKATVSKDSNIKISMLCEEIILIIKEYINEQCDFDYNLQQKYFSELVSVEDYELRHAVVSNIACIYDSFYFYLDLYDIYDSFSYDELRKVTNFIENEQIRKEVVSIKYSREHPRYYKSKIDFENTAFTIINIIKEYGSEYNRPTSRFAAITLEKIIALINKYISIDKQSDNNKISILIDSFFYLIDIYTDFIDIKLIADFRKYLLEEKRITTKHGFDEVYNIIFEDISKLINNDKLILYLKHLINKDYDEAILINPEYEIAHYNKIICMISEVRSLKDAALITDEVRKKIFDNWQYLKELKELSTKGKKPYLRTVWDEEKKKEINLDDFITILKYEKKIFDKNIELERIINRQIKMVRNFTHTWRNLLHPDLVENVIKVLTEESKYEPEVEALFSAYNNEIMLRNEANMLRIRHFGKPSKLKDEIRKCISNEEKNQDGNIQAIISKGIELVCMRVLFNNDDTRCRHIRNKIAVHKETSEVTNNFKQNILVNTKSSINIIEWFSKNVANIKMNNFNADWQNVSVEKGSISYVFILEIFMELLFNMLTYAEYNDAEQAEFVFSSKLLDDTNYLTINCTNTYDDTKYKFYDSKKEGLDGLEESVFMVNCESDDQIIDNYKEKYFFMQKKENMFKLEILLQDDLFLRGEDW